MTCNEMSNNCYYMFTSSIVWCC